jgi:endonuclease/exonuclease/phosphatase family metal-dependent hydrolase
MKLISLNTWGGRAGKEKLLGFFAEHRDADIFCLQEVWSAPYEFLEGHAAGGLAIKNSNVMTRGMQEISGLLDQHARYFKPHYLDNYGLMMLLKKDINIREEGDVFVYKERGSLPEGDVGNHARNIQYAAFTTPRGERTVINFHGLWNGKGKGDSDERLHQSDRIIQFLKTISSPYILCGDFNLLPETDSLKRLEACGLRNLIKEYGITSTRTSLYEKEHKFADYVLVSEGIEVKDFRILQHEVSDHSPLYLEFE